MVLAYLLVCFRQQEFGDPFPAWSRWGAELKGRGRPGNAGSAPHCRSAAGGSVDELQLLWCGPWAAPIPGRSME